MTISNGLAFSPDGRTMYHADTPTQVDPRATTTTPRPERRRTRACSRASPAEGDRPDGAAVDSEGCYWTALYKGGKLKRIAPGRARAARVSGARDVPDDVRVRRPRSQDALRDQRAAAARRRRARATAAVRRHLRDAGRRAGPARARVRRLSSLRSPTAPTRMTFDTTAFVRLDALQSLGTSASGASLATSTGDILEVSCYGPGVFRLRVGPSTQPDYGLVVGRTKAVHGRARAKAARGRSPRATATLEITAAPLRFRLLHRGAPVAGSITDEHFRGWTRLPAFGRVRQGGHWTAALALASGEPVYGLGEKFGPLNKRGQLDPFARRRRARRQHRPRVQERAVRVEPRHRQGRVGALRAHAGVGDARRRASRLVAPLVRRSTSRTRRSISSCSPRTRRPASSTCTRSSPAAPRRCRCGASASGSRAPTTRRRRKRRRWRRSFARTGSRATC